MKQDFRCCDRSGDGVDGGLVRWYKKNVPPRLRWDTLEKICNLLFKYSCILHPHQSLTAIHFILFDEISSAEQS